MKILWHSAAPWEPTGYGGQTAWVCRWLRDQGHEVAISARTGIVYQIADFDGIPVLPAPPLYGDNVMDDLLPLHAAAWQPDLVIVLYDLWHFSLPPSRLPGCPVVFWVPVDCTPIDAKERNYLASGRLYPVAMSEHGRRELTRAGFACGYVPHAIDPDIYAPLVDPSDREKVREAFDIPKGFFAIGVNATSTDAVRKGLFEQIVAFKLFRDKHPKSVMLIHTLPNFALGADVTAMANDPDIGLPMDAFRFPPPYSYLTGQIAPMSMAGWYNACDVVSNCTYGEGFGLAAVEAQACGTPVILSRGSTGQQLVGPGWLVDTQWWWNATHRAKWHQPRIDSIRRAYGQAYLDAKNRRGKAWEFAAGYTIKKVGPLWDGVLTEVMGR